MREVVMYESDDGFMYETRQEALAADRREQLEKALQPVYEYIAENKNFLRSPAGEFSWGGAEGTFGITEREHKLMNAAFIAGRYHRAIEWKDWIEANSNKLQEYVDEQN